MTSTLLLLEARLDGMAGGAETAEVDRRAVEPLGLDSAMAASYSRNDIVYVRTKRVNPSLQQTFAIINRMFRMH